jgi:hypothetical protein
VTGISDTGVPVLSKIISMGVRVGVASKFEGDCQGRVQAELSTSSNIAAMGPRRSILFISRFSLNNYNLAYFL